ncbi:MAG: dihydroorotase family protein [Candidatus Riflebacteria bacterium]
MNLPELPWLDNTGKLRREKLSVENGCIRISRSEFIAETEIKLQNCSEFMLPGLIDCHVHFRQPGQTKKEGISNGCRAAIAGGVTTVCDMPNTCPPTCDAKSLVQKQKLWQHYGRINHRLFLGFNHNFILNDKKWPKTACPAELGIDPGSIAGLKVFFAESGSCPAVFDVETIADLMLNWPLIAFHAEDERLFRTSPGNSHSENRPREAVISALAIIEQAMRIARDKANGHKTARVVLLHLATKEEADWIRFMKAERFDLAAETCPHYLYFTEEDVEKSYSLIKVNPPIREAYDQHALWQAVADGTIDLFSSDHAPHTPAEKQSDNPPSGIPGIERMWQLLAFGVEQGRISWRKAIELACLNAAQCYNFTTKSGIEEGNNADLVVLKRQSTEANHRIITRAQYDPYMGFPFPWQVGQVFISGRKIFHDGKFQEAEC